MAISGIEEITAVKKVVLKPGQKSEIIQRRNNEFLVCIVFSGEGTIIPLDMDNACNFSPKSDLLKFDFRHGREFQVEVPPTPKQLVEMVILTIETF